MRPTPCPVVRISAESDWLWLWPETPSKCVWNSEVVDRVLAVPFDEADRDHAFAQHSWMPIAISLSSVERTVMRRPSASSTAVL